MSFPSLLLLAALACSTGEPVPDQIGARLGFELGATEFRPGDDLVIEELRSMAPESTVGQQILVRGRYELRSRPEAVLYLGTTATSDVEQRTIGRQRVRVRRGSGVFELEHRIPGPGFLHLTFYDSASGEPFGGVYFGQGEGVLHTRPWAYSR